MKQIGGFSLGTWLFVAHVPVEVIKTWVGGPWTALVSCRYRKSQRRTDGKRRGWSILLTEFVTDDQIRASLYVILSLGLGQVPNPRASLDRFVNCKAGGQTVVNQMECALGRGGDRIPRGRRLQVLEHEAEGDVSADLQAGLGLVSHRLRKVGCSEGALQKQRASCTWRRACVG